MGLKYDLLPLSFDDYESIIETYAADAIAIRGVRAVYQFGNVGVPGLSDVDLVVVLDDDEPPTADALRQLSITHDRWRAHPLIQACFVHDVYVCSRRVFADVGYLSPGNKWILRAGGEERSSLVNDEEKAVLDLVNGVDFCIGRLHELVHVKDSGIHSLRRLIPQLWSLTHTRRILAAAGASLEPTWDEVTCELEKMRATPVDNFDLADIEELVGHVLKHFARAIDHFASLLSVRANLGANLPIRECAVASHGRRALHAYQPSAADLRGTQTTAEVLGRSFPPLGSRIVKASWSRLALPAELLVHHLAYLSQDTTFSAVAANMARRAGLKPGENGSAVYRRIVAKRWELTRPNGCPTRAAGSRLTCFRIPGLPVSRYPSAGGDSTWRFRVVRSWLDWRLLPWRAVHASNG
jgi:hypothetical protein